MGMGLTPSPTAGSGDMQAATYDPSTIQANVYARANHTGTQTAATVSDFDAEVSNNVSVAANTSHSGGDGSDHADVATNTAHSGGDGSDHADVATNTAHSGGDGSDHADVATNTSKLSGIATGADVTGDNAPQAHNTSHQSGGGDAIKIDDLAAADDNTDLNASTSAHGLCPKYPNDAAKYLDGTGAYSTPAGTAWDGDIADIDLDGGTDIGAALVDADLILVDDGAAGTNRKSAISRVWTYIEAKIQAMTDLAITTLDIDSGTDIGADLADADLIIVDDGAGGTNRKSAVSRIWTYVLGKLQAGYTMTDGQITRPKFKDYSEAVSALGDLGGGSDNLDIENGNVISATISTSESTLSFTNPSASGSCCSFTLILTNGGSQTVNWPAAVDWAGGTAPSLTSSGVDILTFTTVDAGTTWYGFAAGLDMS